MGRGLGWVTHRGPFQPLPFCDSGFLCCGKQTLKRKSGLNITAELLLDSDLFVAANGACCRGAELLSRLSETTRRFLSFIYQRTGQPRRRPAAGAQQNGSHRPGAGERRAEGPASARRRAPRPRLPPVKARVARRLRGWAPLSALSRGLAVTFRHTQGCGAVPSGQ